MEELKSEGEKRVEFRCKFNCKSIKRIREGDGGRRPYRRTVFKDGTD